MIEKILKFVARSLISPIFKVIYEDFAMTRQKEALSDFLDIQGKERVAQLLEGKAMEVSTKTAYEVEVVRTELKAIQDEYTKLKRSHDCFVENSVRAQEDFRRQLTMLRKQLRGEDPVRRYESQKTVVEELDFG